MVVPALRPQSYRREPNQRASGYRTSQRIEAPQLRPGTNPRAEHWITVAENQAGQWLGAPPCSRSSGLEIRLAHAGPERACGNAVPVPQAVSAIDKPASTSLE